MRATAWRRTAAQAGVQTVTNYVYDEANQLVTTTAGTAVTTIYTQDFTHDRLIEGVRFINPFA